MKIMDAIGKGFSLAGKNIGVLTVIFVFNAVWNLVTLPFMGEAANAAAVKISPPLALAGMVFILVNIFVQGGVFGILKDALGSEGTANLANFTAYGRKFYLRFMGLGAVIIGLLAVSLLIAVLLFSFAAALKVVAVSIILIVAAAAFVVAGLYYLCLLFLSPYVLVAENTTIFKAMANSMKFTKANFMKVSGLLSLLVLIGLGLGFATGALSGVIFLVIKGVAFQAITAIISSAANAYITVIITTAVIAYYMALSGSGRQENKPSELSA